MTAAARVPSGPCIFSMFADEGVGQYCARRETFVLSMVGQALILGLIIYFTSCVIQDNPRIARQIPKAIRDLPLVFGTNGEEAAISTSFPPRMDVCPKLLSAIRLHPPR